VAPTDTRAVRHERLRRELGERFIAHADLVEGRVDFTETEVFVDVEGMRHVGGVKHEIEGEFEGCRPVLVGVADEGFGAEGEGVVFFVRRVRDDGYVGAEGVGPDDGEVA
jgi:hypothetical protein